MMTFTNLFGILGLSALAVSAIKSYLKTVDKHPK